MAKYEVEKYGLTVVMTPLTQGENNWTDYGKILNPILSWSKSRFPNSEQRFPNYFWCTKNNNELYLALTMFNSKDRNAWTVYETVYYIFWIIRSPKDNHLDFISKNTLLISDLKSRFSLICEPYKINGPWMYISYTTIAWASQWGM